MIPNSHAPAPALLVRNLSAGFGTRPGSDPVVDGVSFDVAAGTCLAVVGESGSGKSVTARSLLGLTGRNSWVRADAMELGGTSALGLSESAWRRRRGRDVGLVLQDALVSLDPLRPVGREIADSLRLHGSLPPRERQAAVLELLDQVGLPDAANKARQRAGELSGGQRQRALIASAIALRPPLLIADEPTTALDVTVQAQILELMESLKRTGTGILLVSHDLAVVARIADEIAVMSRGRFVEHGPAATLLADPRHPVTRRMVAAIPVDKPRGTPLGAPSDSAPRPVVTRPRTPSPSPVPVPSQPVVEATGLVKTFRRPDGAVERAVDDVSFQLERGTTLGIVGESGSGKTTTARLVLALTAPDAGTVRLMGQPFSAATERERRALRPQLGAVYQDALSSFDPRLTVGQVLRDAVGADHAVGTRILELLDWVGLSPTLLGRRPRSLSGGQRQRVGIARALASRPQVLVCDEPVSALDVTVQAQVLDLLDELQRELDLSMLFISHDLGVIQHVSDRVAVMRSGRIVETGEAGRVFTAPEHPYTQRLIAAVPRLV
jgi:peptide/nickel transport system ATP-binding protein